MTGIEFKKQVDALRQKAAAIDFGDYQGAMSVINEFETFAGTNFEYIYNQYVTEHIASIKAAFELMRDAKSHGDQLQSYQRGARNLESDIAAMHYKAPATQ